eukprot:GHVS01007089.1.p1 GENE.GHVS01007089.1~~GHVS01007089.1.p1  ORF type:complete len:212 (-),score=61.71 GHVS01007089.1:145-780(-)
MSIAAGGVGMANSLAASSTPLNLFVPDKPTVSQLPVNWRDRFRKTHAALAQTEVDLKTLVELQADVHRRDQHNHRKAVDELTFDCLDVRTQVNSIDKQLKVLLPCCQQQLTTVHLTKGLFDAATSSSPPTLSVPSKPSTWYLQEQMDSAERLLQDMKELQVLLEGLRGGAEGSVFNILEGIQNRLRQCHEREVNLVEHIQTATTAIAKRGW